MSLADRLAQARQVRIIEEQGRLSQSTGASTPFALRRRSTPTDPFADLKVTVHHALLDTLGPNGQLMVNLIPELEFIIGKQPPVADLPPRESRNRFQLVFRRFLVAFATAEHPLGATAPADESVETAAPLYVGLDTLADMVL